MYLSAVIYARIKQVATGEVIDLWQPDYPYLQSAKITLNRGGIATVEVSLTIPYDDFIDLVDNRQPHIFDIGNILSVRFGYEDEGLYTPWYHGLVFEPSVPISPDTVSVTLTGQPMNSMLRTSGVKSWSNVSAHDIAQSIARKFGYDLEYMDGDTDAIQKLAVKIPALDQGGVTDWETMKGVIEQRGCTFWFGTNRDGKSVVFVSSLKKMNASVPVRRFVMRGVFDPTISQYPLLSFDADAKQAWLPAISQGIVSKEIDRDSKQIETISVNNGTSDVPSPMARVMHGGNDSKGKKDSLSGLVHSKGIREDDYEVPMSAYVPTGDNKSLERDALQSRYDESRALAGIQATASILGNIHVKPMDLVQIAGVSRRFEGVYRVEQVEHEISDGKWSTGLELRCEGYSEGLDFAQRADNATGYTSSKDRPE